MKNRITLSIIALAIVVGTRMVSAQTVTADFDKTVDFSKYKTFTFMGWVENSEKQIPEFDQKRIIDAFRTEFDARGMQHVDEGGQLAVTLYVVLSKETSTTAYTNYTGGYGYGGRWGWGYGGMGSSHTTYSTDDYIEGTLVIDFYDQSTKNLVYQGVIKATVKEKPEKREKSIPKNIHKLMAKYPVKPMKK